MLSGKTHAVVLGNRRARTILMAALMYFFFATVLGFVLGMARILLLVPHIGSFRAVALELPIMLAATWMVWARISTVFDTPLRIREGMIAGGVSFALLLVAEFLIAKLLQGETIQQFLWALASPHGILGLAGQTLYALFPTLQSLSHSGRKTGQTGG